MPGFDIRQKGGVRRLVPSISVEVKVPDRVALGIMVDANTDLRSRWESIRGQLQKANMELPRHVDNNGTIIHSAGEVGAGVTVGVWVMPDNAAGGHIEDFVAGLIPMVDPVWPLAQDYIRRIPEDHQPRDRSKAELHSWLAARSEPRRMGQAIGFGDLELAGTDRFVAWLRCLFGS